MSNIRHKLSIITTILVQKVYHYKVLVQRLLIYGITHYALSHQLGWIPFYNSSTQNAYQSSSKIIPIIIKLLLCVFQCLTCHPPPSGAPACWAATVGQQSFPGRGCGNNLLYIQHRAIEFSAQGIKAFNEYSSNINKPPTASLLLLL